MTPEEYGEIGAHVYAEQAAQQRDTDPAGDPDAPDPGDCEPYADTDPAPQLPADAADQLDDLAEGDDLADDEDLDGADDD